MNEDQSKEMKRIKLLRAGFIVCVILVLISLCQLIFESGDTYRKVIQSVVLIFWVAAAIINWFGYKKVKEHLQNQV